MIGKDFTAFKNMMNSETFGDEIFGFNGQQAVERLLKAWISPAGNENELTHDIENLLL